MLIATDLEWLARTHDACPGALRCVLLRFGDQATYEYLAGQTSPARAGA